MAELRKIGIQLAAFLALGTGVSACDWMQKKDPPGQKTKAELVQEQEARIRRACASDSTYDRLKELAFDEASRVRNRDPRELDSLAMASIVRMERPVVKSRDEELNVTVCTGRFILELPPGAENAFDGERRLSAEVEYAAQAALDGSGLVYHMEGAEPIIYRLATVGGFARAVAQPQPTPTPWPSPRVYAEAPPPPADAPPQAQPRPQAPAPQAAPQPERRPPPPAAAPRAPAREAARRVEMARREEAQRKAAPPRPAEAPRQAQAPRREARGSASPSFSCRSARTRTERMVCSSGGLAARDRRMASIYYAEIAEADPETRNRLRRSRDRFLARRERCGTEACVAAAYEDRIQEIRGISRRQ